MPSDRLGSLGRVPLFAHPAEREFARLLDEQGLRWRYEPTTFVLRRDEDGRVREAVTPDFYLPELELYVELTAMRPSLAGPKRRKLRLLRELYPAIRVSLLDRRALEALGVDVGEPVAAVGHSA